MPNQDLQETTQAGLVDASNVVEKDIWRVSAQMQMNPRDKIDLLVREVVVVVVVASSVEKVGILQENVQTPMPMEVATEGEKPKGRHQIRARDRKSQEDLVRDQCPAQTAAELLDCSMRSF